MHRFRRPGMFVITLLALGMQLIAQQSSKSVVIHAGHVLDVKTGKLLSDQTLIIEDGKILSVGASSEAESAAGRGCASS